MNNQTKLYFGLALVGVGAYLLWQQKSKKDALPAPVPAASAESASFAGTDEQDVVGRRMKMAGFVAQNKNVQSSDWLRADGSSIAPTFFDVQSSNWLRN